MITWRPALIWARTSLAVRVALTSGITLLLLGVLLIGSFLREDIEQVRRTMATELAQEITLLAATLVEPAVVGDYTLIRQLLTVQATHQDVQRIAWTDNLGHALAVHGPAIPAAPTWFALLADVPDVESEQAIRVGGQSYGKISVRLTAASRIHAVWSATTARLALAAMGISICIALTSWIVLRGLLPFSDLAHAARRFGRGEHGLRIKATGPPESRSCIDAFNRMGADLEGLVDSLKTAELNLQRANAELERRVKLRTAELEQANRGLQAEVSERRLAEAALRVSEENARRLARVVEQATDGIITRDMNGVITSWNAATAGLLGFSADEAIGKPLGTLHQANFTPEECAATLQRIRDGIPKIFETERLDRQGIAINLHIAASPIYDGGGVQCGEMSVFRDITERKRIEKESAQAREAAETANRAKSQFLANMSHEIRTPMNGVLGMAELLLGTRLDSHQEKFALAIHQSGTVLLQLINDILDFSKIEAGRLELQLVTFRLRHLVSEIIDLLHESAHARELSLSYTIDEDVPDVLVSDPLRLRQILTNLIGNALKFTEVGHVRLQVNRTPDESMLQPDPQDSAGPPTLGILFAVHDTGIGIPADATERLFTRFSQADGSMTRRFGGSGLGLAISKQLAESMGGRIGVESKAGSGSNFWFTVRMAVDATGIAVSHDIRHDGATTRAAMEVSAPDQTTNFPAVAPLRTKNNPEAVGTTSNARRGRVLLAEDNPINRQIATVMLESFGCNVIHASDGRQAIERSSSQDFDLILMDCQMPELDGFEATTAIRSREATRAAKNAVATTHGRARTPIVAVTANAIQGDRERCIEAGMDDYLSKPFAKKHLRALIERWIPSIEEPLEQAHRRAQASANPS